jgi:hypothetical protein
MRVDFNENPEAMVLDMIRFLKGWGLWKDVNIFAGGRRYSYEKGSCFQGITDVAYEENIDPEEWMKGPVGEGERLRWESFANPEHLFDMTYEGPLHMLLNHDEYAPDREEISARCWKYIEENTDLIEEYIFENYDVSSREELAYEMWAGIFDNPEICYWDPLEFDIWEEYLELFYGDDEESNLAFLQFDTYEEYCEARDGGIDRFVSEHAKEIQMVWERMTEEAGRELKKEKGALPDEIRDHVYEEFARIFERYGLYHDYCFRWSLTSYRIGD